MSTQAAILIANILWFGLFAVGIFYFSWSPLCLIVPVLFHWTPSDFTPKQK